jgi:hypothetical protein
MSKRMRGKTCHIVVLMGLWASVMGCLLVMRSACFAAEDPPIRIVVKGKVTVTGIGPPQIIDRVGDLQPGVWVEPDPGSVAYLIRESGVESLPAGIRTRVAAAPPILADTSKRRSLVDLIDLIVALFLPKEQLSKPAITKGDGDGQTVLYRVLYPRDSKVADREPVLAWAGGGDQFEVRLYRSGVDYWLWKQTVRGARRATLTGQHLEDGQTYFWEVRDTQNPENVATASFDTPSGAERRHLDEAIRKVRESCRGTIPSFTCELAVAGLYTKEGYVYDAIRVLEAIRSVGQNEAIVKSLLSELEY